ncbi:MAG: glycoside hydrolase family 2 TIM barrel-domain containing protein [Bacteroidota bacterium]
MKIFFLNILAVFCYLLFSGGVLFAQQADLPEDEAPRLKKSINDDWDFRFDESEVGDWKEVDLPYTWNNKDAFDEESGYNRTVGLYQKELDLEPEPEKKYILVFEAVNQTADIYINGEHAANHKGGYTAFTVDATPYLKEEGPNEIQVKVDNRHDENIPPLKGDFNFYGGIYRDVWLMELNDTHFDFGDYGSSGIFVTTPEVSDSSASVQIEGNISSEDSGQSEFRIVNTLYDPDEQKVVQKEKNIDATDEERSFTETFESVDAPELWHPDHPNLYTVISEIKSKDGSKVFDQKSTSIGFRWFDFDADKGFILNGEPLKLKGVNRHQDYKGKANALSNARHVADMELAKETGANFLRTAHYPQDPAVLEAADRLGLLVTIEIPLDHEITDSKGFYENSVRMQREMIRQNFNHPSIIVWAYMNEMLLGRNWEDDRDHINKIVDFAKELEAVTREEDSTRYTMIPNHGDFELYHKSGLTDIPMLVGWNLYFGWYESDLEGAGDFLDRHHEKLPEQPVLITEYGAGSDPRIRTEDPLRFDFSVEWQNRFMQQNLEEIYQRDFVAGAAVWNLFDFGSASRRDAVPAINSKGLMTFDREPKDSYQLLRAWFSEEPTVRIGSKSWEQRTGKVDSGKAKVSTQKVAVYGNTGDVELHLNGESLGQKDFKNHIAVWDVPFTDGRNVLRATTDDRGKEAEDVATVNFEMHYPQAETSRKGFKDIYVNAGANFYFVDEKNGMVWHPDEPYEQGFWGYKGGERFMPRNRGIGSPEDIMGTQHDPLFQTQRIDAGQYRFDIPKGTYEVTFLFADLRDETSIFDVFINDDPVLKDVTLGAEKSPKAIEKSVVIDHSSDSLVISFGDSEENAVNGIGVRKIK